jgi:hypothetical protein
LTAILRPSERSRDPQHHICSFAGLAHILYSHCLHACLGTYLTNIDLDSSSIMHHTLFFCLYTPDHCEHVVHHTRPYYLFYLIVSLNRIALRPTFEPSSSAISLLAL